MKSREPFEGSLQKQTERMNFCSKNDLRKIEVSNRETSRQNFIAKFKSNRDLNTLNALFRSLANLLASEADKPPERMNFLIKNDESKWRTRKQIVFLKICP